MLVESPIAVEALTFDIVTCGVSGILTPPSSPEGEEQPSQNVNDWLWLLIDFQWL